MHLCNKMRLDIRNILMKLAQKIKPVQPMFKRKILMHQEMYEDRKWGILKEVPIKKRI
jgi:hypothetical protein